MRPLAAPRGDSDVTARTITQFAHQQLYGGWRVRYDTRLHSIHAGDQKHILIEAMAELCVATEASLARINAEFWQGELRASLHVFVLDQYTSELLNIYEQTAEEGGELRKRLCELLVHWQRRGAALKMEVRPRDVLLAVRGAHLQRELSMASSEPRSVHEPGNRACWVRAIAHAIGTDKHAKAFELLNRLLPFYFSLETGTHNCELGRGRHATHRFAHVGPSERQHCWSAMLFEVHEDGPDGESDVASKGLQGNVLFFVLLSSLAVWRSFGVACTVVGFRANDTFA